MDPSRRTRMATRNRANTTLETIDSVSVLVPRDVRFPFRLLDLHLVTVRGQLARRRISHAARWSLSVIGKKLRLDALRRRLLERILI